MRAIDVAVFLFIFEFVLNLLANFASDLGFRREEVIVANPGVNIETETQKQWQHAQTIASAAILMGTVAGAFLSAVFGQYYLSLLLAAAGVVINFIPVLRQFVSALPMLLISLGLPPALAWGLYTIYNFLLVLMLLLWLSGKGGY
jgi:hypothetical protein